jgi:hypothetical protein
MHILASPRLLEWLVGWVLDATSLALIITSRDFLSAQFNDDMMEMNAMILATSVVQMVRAIFPFVLTCYISADYLHHAVTMRFVIHQFSCVLIVLGPLVLALTIMLVLHPVPHVFVSISPLLYSNATLHKIQLSVTNASVGPIALTLATTDVGIPPHSRGGWYHAREG